MKKVRKVKKQRKKNFENRRGFINDEQGQNMVNLTRKCVYFEGAIVYFVLR